MLRVEELEVRYQDLTALRRISLGIDDGEFVAIIGSNGSGKTTLLNCISGLIPANSGRILWKGMVVSGMPPDQVCRFGITQVPEGRKLFPKMTVEENLELGAYLPAARAKFRENKERVFNLFPKLAERRMQPAGSLSGGEQQMLAVSRALMACPQLLMLDEPSLGLAPIAAKEVFRIISVLNREGLTVMLVSQEVRQALEIAQRVYLMENGKVVLSGPACEMAEDPRIKESYLGL